LPSGSQIHYKFAPMIHREGGTYFKPLFEVRTKDLADIIELGGTMPFKLHQQTFLALT
jgi:hypothetical protein